jgi:hypothetical protein
LVGVLGWVRVVHHINQPAGPDGHDDLFKKVTPRSACNSAFFSAPQRNGFTPGNLAHRVPCVIASRGDVAVRSIGQPAVGRGDAKTASFEIQANSPRQNLWERRPRRELACLIGFGPRAGLPQPPLYGAVTFGCACWMAPGQ